MSVKITINLNPWPTCLSLAQEDDPKWFSRPAVIKRLRKQHDRLVKKGYAIKWEEII